MKKQVVVTTTQNVVKKSTTQQSAKVSVVDIEVASRKKAHKATNLAYAGIGAARAADSFSRAIRESSDEGSDDEEVGTDAWKEQQEKRRARYRMTTTSSELYDVQSVREKREEQERLRVEHERARRARSARRSRRSGWSPGRKPSREAARRAGVGPSSRPRSRRDGIRTTPRRARD